MLKAHIKRMKTHPSEHAPQILVKLGAIKAVEEFRHQLEGYWRSEYPFDSPVRDGDVLGWWRALAQHPQARVLAVSQDIIQSSLPNVYLMGLS